MALTAKTRVRAKGGAAIIWTPQELRSLILEDPAILGTTDRKERLKLLKSRMHAIFPENRWRNDHSLQVCVVDSPEQFERLVIRAKHNLKRVVLDKKGKPFIPKPKPAAKTTKPAAKTRKLTVVTNAGTPVAQPAPAPAPPPPIEAVANADDNLLADAVLGAALRDILTTAVGSGIALAIDTAVRTNMQVCVNDAIGRAKLPTRESLLADMEEMLVRLLGGPTSAPAAPPPEPVPALPLIPAIVHQPIEIAPPPVAQVAPPSEPEPEPEPERTKPVQPKDVAPHDLPDQLEAVAKALGMPQVKRPNVVVCGLHPKVMQDLEHVHGRNYRFQYIKQDHLNEASHLPASTDALILCRKKLNNDVMGAVRRYAIPWKSVANSVPAAEWALKEIFA